MLCSTQFVFGFLWWKVALNVLVACRPFYRLMNERINKQIWITLRRGRRFVLGRWFVALNHTEYTVNLTTVWLRQNNSSEFIVIPVRSHVTTRSNAYFVAGRTRRYICTATHCTSKDATGALIRRRRLVCWVSVKISRASRSKRFNISLPIRSSHCIHWRKHTTESSTRWWMFQGLEFRTTSRY